MHFKKKYLIGNKFNKFRWQLKKMHNKFEPGVKLIRKKWVYLKNVYWIHRTIPKFIKDIKDFKNRKIMKIKNKIQKTG